MAMAFPIEGVEIHFPIPSDIHTDTEVIITDSAIPKRLVKNQSTARQEICKINVKIKDDYMKTWLDYIEANFSATVNWELSGVQLFTRASTSVQVKIVDYTEPIKPEKTPLHWDMQITLLYIGDQ